ncbi:MAG: ribbon-helix-helix domain-containing protein [bacterium]
MGREDLVTRKAVGWTFDKKLVEWVVERSKKTHIPRGRIVDQALKEYKEKLEKQEK